MEHELREAVRSLCAKYPHEYWQKHDRERAYPLEFVNELTAAGYLSALIPEEYGGAGLSIAEAATILEEINRSGANSAACHAQMYTMGTLLRHGSDEQKQRYLPRIASGELRLQAFGVTEQDAGTDTLSISTFAERRGDRYVVNGKKIFISRVQHSDLMILLARTARPEAVKKKTLGLSTFLVDLREVGDSMKVRPVDCMINHETNELFFDDMEIPAENLIGEEGQGFSHILGGMNAERILLGSESIGDARYFIGRASQYAGERVVFDRPIGQNQGVQFPITRAYIATEAAAAIRDKATALYATGKNCGTEANMCKYLASEAAWQAANAAMDTFGGYGMAEEYGIERKFREARLYLIAPIANNLILSFVGQHVLGMPRSF